MPDIIIKPRAYSYLRYSTPEQGRGDSLRRQLEAAAAYAVENGLELDENLHDLGVSAFHGEHRTRGALGSFLAAIREGKVASGSVLIVESLDRLSRETVLSALGQLMALVGAGIEVVTLSDRQRYSTGSIQADWTRLIISLTVMARAHEESERKSQRVGAAWQAKRRRAEGGEAMTARCVAWCRLEGKGRDRRYVLIEQRAAVVRRIFEASAAGIGQWRLACDLNREGVPTFGSGKGWHPSYILKILSNRAAIGVGQPYRLADSGRVPEGRELPGYYPAAVEEQLFHSAQAARSRRRGRGGRKGLFVSNLFSGLARCFACGAPMTHVNKGEGSKGGRYLVCDSFRRGRRCDNPKPRWSYEQTESDLLSWISEIDWGALSGTDDFKQGLHDELERQRARKSRLAAEIESLLESFGSASAISQVADRIRALHAEVGECASAIQAIERRLADAQAQTLGVRRLAYHACLDRMDAAAPEELASVRAALADAIRKVVGRIELDDDRIRIFGPSGELLHTFVPNPMAMPRDMVERYRQRSREKARAARAGAPGVTACPPLKSTPLIPSVR